MTTTTVIVHNPIPDDLQQILTDAGYQKTSATPKTTTFTHPRQSLQHSAVRVLDHDVIGVLPGDRPKAPVGRLMFTPNELADALGISRSGLYVLMAKGDIRSVRIGGARRIPTDEVARYVQSLKDDFEALQVVN